MPQTQNNSAAIAGDNDTNVSVYGVTTDYLAVNDREMGLGRFFSDTELNGSARVVVLGVTTAEDLFGTVENAIGQQVRIRSVYFDVIGVLNDTGEDSDEAALASAGVMILFGLIAVTQDARAGQPLNRSNGLMGVGAGFLILSAVLIVTQVLPLAGVTGSAAMPAMSSNLPAMQRSARRDISNATGIRWRWASGITVRTPGISLN